MKKIISILLATVLLLTSMAVSAFAETLPSGTCGNNLTWTLDLNKGELVISGEGAMNNYTINYPNGTLTTGSPWYENRSKINTITISDGVTSIGSNAFFDCHNLVKVSVGNDVTSIGEDAFRNCNSLVKITLGNSVASIGNGAFLYCESLKSITIPDSVTTIGDLAFCNCNNLTDATLGKSVTYIGDHAFNDCHRLKNITIPDSVISIGEEAFYSCNVTSINIPKSVTTIGDLAFMKCSNLQTITVDTANVAYSSDAYGVLFNKDQTELIYYPCGNTQIAYTIPNGVESISNYAFYDCNKLTNIIFSDSVTRIGYNAFYESSLTSVTFGKGITSIPSTSFERCYSLKSVTIPITVEFIYNGAFKYCSIKDIYYEGTQEMWEEVIIATNNGGIGGSATVHFGNVEPEIPSEPEVICKEGDLNGDGNINSSDALFILQYAVGSAELDENSLALADVTHDGRVNSTDALKILQFAVGIIDQL